MVTRADALRLLDDCVAKSVGSTDASETTRVVLAARASGVVSAVRALGFVTAEEAAAWYETLAERLALRVREARDDGPADGAEAAGGSANEVLVREVLPLRAVLHHRLRLLSLEIYSDLTAVQWCDFAPRRTSEPSSHTDPTDLRPPALVGLGLSDDLGTDYSPAGCAAHREGPRQIVRGEAAFCPAVPLDARELNIMWRDDVVENVPLGGR